MANGINDLPAVALVRYADLDVYEKAFLLTVLGHKDGRMYVAAGDAAKHMGMGRTAFYATRARLVEKSLIHVMVRPRSTTVYTINADGLRLTAGCPSDGTLASVSRQGDRPSGDRGVSVSRQGGVRVAALEGSPEGPTEKVHDEGSPSAAPSATSGSLLDFDAPLRTRTPVASGKRRNRQGSNCRRCGQYVESGRGFLDGKDGTDWVVVHEECPTARPTLSVVEQPEPTPEEVSASQAALVGLRERVRAAIEAPAQVGS